MERDPPLPYILAVRGKGMCERKTVAKASKVVCLRLAGQDLPRRSFSTL
jgi:hypothetical protein